ncbi:MAG: Proposed peptidoglycan lipid II flippase MurJ, partial [uncultured Solirubrobacteraceae bacterium]
DSGSLLPAGPAGGGVRSARRRSSGRGRSGAQAGVPDRDLLAADGILARLGARPGGRRRRLLRHARRDVGLPARLPAAQPGAFAVRRRGAVGRLHPGLHRAARGRQAPGRLPPGGRHVRAHPRRAGHSDRRHGGAGVVRRAAADRLGVHAGARRADHRAGAGDVPDRRAAGPQRPRRRSPQRPRPLLGPGRGPGGVEPGHHRRPRRPAGPLRGRRAHLRLRDRRAGRHRGPAADVAGGVSLDRLQHADLLRVARPAHPPDPRPHAAGDDRPRVDQLQHADQRRPRLRGLRAGLRGHQLRLPHLHAAAGRVLGRGGHRPVSRALAAGRPPRRRRPAVGARHRDAPDRPAADPGHRGHPRAGRADDAPGLRAWRVRSRLDRDGHRGPVLVLALAALLGHQPAADADLLLASAPVGADRAGRRHAGPQRDRLLCAARALRHRRDRGRHGGVELRHDGRSGDRAAPPSARPRARADPERLRADAPRLGAARSGRLRGLARPRRAARPQPARPDRQRRHRRRRRHRGLRRAAARAARPRGPRDRRDAPRPAVAAPRRL